MFCPGVVPMYEMCCMNKTLTCLKLTIIRAKMFSVFFFVKKCNKLAFGGVFERICFDITARNKEGPGSCGPFTV